MKESRNSQRSRKVAFGLARRRVLYVGVEPAEHLVNVLFVGLQCRVPMRLVRKNYQARGAAVAANGFEELGGLQRRGAGILCVQLWRGVYRGSDTRLAARGF